STRFRGRRGGTRSCTPTIPSRSTSRAGTRSSGRTRTRSPGCTSSGAGDSPPPGYRRRMRAVVAAFAALALSGCHRDVLPDHWTLAGDGATVVVDRSPYRVHVLDPDGNEILASTPDEDHDGYGALGWTTGSTEWGNVFSQGWFTFSATLGRW